MTHADFTRAENLLRARDAFHDLGDSALNDAQPEGAEAAERLRQAKSAVFKLLTVVEARAAVRER